MTYLNACIAKDQGQGFNTGLCAEQGTACEEIYMPVCGIGVRTYDISVFWIMLVLGLPMRESVSDNRDKIID